MRKAIPFIAAFLLISAVIAAAFAFREYRRERNGSQNVYTRSIKKHDIVDSARNAISALQDAEVREQNYILTGETAYSEAYARSIRDWQDESGTLALVAEHDPALPLVQELSKAGERTVKELALIVSLYDTGSRDKALDRIRKGAGIVYLDQARDLTVKILDVDDKQVDPGNRLRILNRLAEAVAALFILTLIGALLLIFQTRRGGGPVSAP
jgi:CHASE3 domain sensor protein